MNRALLWVGCWLALLGGAFAETEADFKEVTSLRKTGPDEYTFYYSGWPGRTYFFQTSVDLVDWLYVPDNIVWIAPIVETEELKNEHFNDEFMFSLPGRDRFYVRLAIWYLPTTDALGADFDGDKVANAVELRVGTDPLLPADDLDGDGIASDWEIRFGLNSEDASDGSLDRDGDGFSNLAEFQDGPFGTDPTDYYNGNFPDIVQVSGGGERGDPGTFSTQPLVLKLMHGGMPLGLSPITLSTGDPTNGQVSVTNSGTGLQTVLPLTTDSGGLVSVYYKHPAALPDEPLKQRNITAQVGSAVREGATFRRTYYEITLYDYTYPANTVGLSASEAIDDRIAGKVAATALPVFSVQDHNPTPPALPTYVRNTASWCYDLRQQMTCISPYYSHDGQGTNQYAFTAITPQHVITSGHIDVLSLMRVGDTIRFVTTDNPTTVITKTIRGKVRHPAYQGNPDYYPDFTVCTLDTPLPSSITPCQMLPANYASYLSHLGPGRPPVMILNQAEQALVFELKELGQSATLQKLAKFAAPELHLPRLDYHQALGRGDSGNPAFLIIKPPNTGLDTLVLLTTMTRGFGNEDGTFVTPQISALNAMIAAADADATNRNPLLPPINTGLQVQTIDLSGFNTYSPP